MLASITRILLILLSCISFQGLTEEKKKVTTFNLLSGIWPPYTTEKRNGFEDLLAKELYRRLGYQVLFYNIAGERALVNLNQGRDDGILSRIAGLQKLYPNILPINEVAVEWNFVAFTNNKKVRIKSWQDFEFAHIDYLVYQSISPQSVALAHVAADFD